MQPIIGIIGKTDENKKSEVNKDYVGAIEKSGGVPILLPYSKNADIISYYVKICDGFLFVGGVDINPSYYGEKILNDTVSVCKERDEFDFAVIKEVFKTSKPILAICRGIQLVNVAMGGTLIQDIPTQINSQILHKQREGRYEFSHGVSIEKNSPLYEIVKLDNLRVNSFHHQAIAKLGKNLSVMAKSEDGIIEAVCGVGDRYIRAYQWHAELLFDVDESARQIFREFVLASAKNS